MKRLLTGAVYLLVLLAFFVLRVYFCEPLYFDLLILIFSVIGTFEMCRALGGRIDRMQKGIVQIFSAGFLICYCVSDSVYKYLQAGAAEGTAVVNYSPNLAFVVFMAGIAVLFSLLVFRHEKTSFESAGYSLLAYCFPSVFLLVLCGVNHMPKYSEIGILFIFVLCPFADCLAYVFGKLFGKKLPMKMAPNVSPNKTVIGGFGGILGGAIGAIALFYVYYALSKVNLLPSADVVERPINLILFVGLGILTAAFAEVGDLVESAIKRRLGIKDMGKLLPGHGGILDRIDSSLYACLIVCFVLVLRIMIAG